MLLGRGGNGDWPAQELERMVAAVRAEGRYPRVKRAFFDAGTPPLHAVLERLMENGARRIIVAPVFVPAEILLHEWVKKLVRRWMRKGRVQDAEVVLAPAQGKHPAFGEAVIRQLADAEGGADVRADAPERDKANPWNRIPAHRYHVLVCEGPRCAALGSRALFLRLRERLALQGMSADDGDPERGVAPGQARRERATGAGGRILICALLKQGPAGQVPAAAA